MLRATALRKALLPLDSRREELVRQGLGGATSDGRWAASEVLWSL